MSRKIDLTKELSEEDVAYLKARCRGHELEWNRQLLAGNVDPETPPAPDLPSQILVGGDTVPEPISTTVQEVSIEIARSLNRIPAEEETEEAEEGDDNYDDEAAWSYKELQAELKERELPATGDRAELIERLREDDAS